MTLRRWAQLGLVVVGALLVFVAHLGVVKVVVALVACYVMFRVGFTVIGSFARPVPRHRHRASCVGYACSSAARCAGPRCA